jgi:RNA polymerase sigma-70 factor (ECF subfamily)
MNQKHEAVPLTDQHDLDAKSVSEPAGFAELYDRYLPRVYKYFRYRIGDPHASEDLTSRVFVLVLANILSYQEDKGPLSRWIFTIAHNTLADYMRARKRNRCVPIENAGQIACPAEGPAETLIRREKLDRLLAAVARLSDRERDIISLKFAAGLTNGAISEITGLTKSNVAVIIYRALQRLRSELSDEGSDEDDE